MHSLNTASISSFVRAIDIAIVLICLVISIRLYLYLKDKIKENEVFSGIKWGFLIGLPLGFALGLIIGGLADIIFYRHISILLSEQLGLNDEGYPKTKKEKSLAMTKALKRNLGIGFTISLIGGMAIKVLIAVIAAS